ncbi:MAG: homoserine kinase [Bacillota bacterium]|nr:homoserine kinase [Bacillota bacterium]
MFKVRIPATTANMGPGFDTLGMALKLYNELEVEEINNKIEFLQNNEPSIIPLEENLIYSTMTKVFNIYNFKPKGFKINFSKCEVPVSRGLGSSATCISGGIAAANYLMGNILSTEDFINIATEIEGHPDNVVPSIVGGMTISIKSGDNITFSKVNIPSNISFAVMIPGFKVSTESTRKVLPLSYSRTDCIFNISRAAMFISAMQNKELDKLRLCLDDKIHQPYRKVFIENIDDIFLKAEAFGSLGEFISGSGSTLIAVVEDSKAQIFENQIKNYLSTLKNNWEFKILKPDLEGLK